MGMNLLIDSDLCSAFSGLISFAGGDILLLDYNLSCTGFYFIIGSCIRKGILLADCDLISVF
jgi:hypothetical protein